MVSMHNKQQALILCPCMVGIPFVRCCGIRLEMYEICVHTLRPNGQLKFRNKHHKIHIQQSIYHVSPNTLINAMDRRQLNR